MADSRGTWRPAASTATIRKTATRLAFGAVITAELAAASGSAFAHGGGGMGGMHGGGGGGMQHMGGSGMIYGGGSGGNPRGWAGGGWNSGFPHASSGNPSPWSGGRLDSGTGGLFAHGGNPITHGSPFGYGGSLSSNGTSSPGSAGNNFGYRGQSFNGRSDFTGSSSMGSYGNPGQSSVTQNDTGPNGSSYQRFGNTIVSKNVGPGGTAISITSPTGYEQLFRSPTGSSYSANVNSENGRSTITSTDVSTNRIGTSSTTISTQADNGFPHNSDHFQGQQDRLPEAGLQNGHSGAQAALLLTGAGLAFPAFVAYRRRKILRLLPKAVRSIFGFEEPVEDHTPGLSGRKFSKNGSPLPYFPGAEEAEPVTDLEFKRIQKVWFRLGYPNVSRHADGKGVQVDVAGGSQLYQLANQINVNHANSDKDKLDQDIIAALTFWKAEGHTTFRIEGGERELRERAAYLAEHVVKGIRVEPAPPLPLPATARRPVNNWRPDPIGGFGASQLART